MRPRFFWKAFPATSTPEISKQHIAKIGGRHRRARSARLVHRQRLARALRARAPRRPPSERSGAGAARDHRLREGALQHRARHGSIRMRELSRGGGALSPSRALLLALLHRRRRLLGRRILRRVERSSHRRHAGTAAAIAASAARGARARQTRRHHRPGESKLRQFLPRFQGRRHGRLRLHARRHEGRPSAGVVVRSRSLTRLAGRAQRLEPGEDGPFR